MKELLRDLLATMGIYDAPREGRVHGLLAEYQHPGALLSAAKRMREEGFRHYDAHSPFPIHGMDGAMGLGNSKVGFSTLGGGLTGLALGTWMQWWMSEVDYPLNISGKPTFAFEYGMPIMFELTVLLAALGTAAGMLALNGLPRPHNPIFHSDRFARASDDSFFIYVSASDKKFDVTKTAEILASAGALHVETVAEPAEDAVGDGDGVARTETVPAGEVPVMTPRS